MSLASPSVEEWIRAISRLPIIPLRVVCETRSVRLAIHYYLSVVKVPNPGNGGNDAGIVSP